ncbi:hypothetical protein WMY93_024634 [Mugilogobius chulae]|uniref:Uncharacterized protein n=1 Tax=Mugilogobius chulae TaxID=88201 RepID=A0AAW0N4L0_9GOBI
MSPSGGARARESCVSQTNYQSCSPATCPSPPACPLRLLPRHGEPIAGSERNTDALAAAEESSSVLRHSSGSKASVKQKQRGRDEVKDAHQRLSLLGTEQLPEVPSQGKCTRCFCCKGLRSNAAAETSSIIKRVDIHEPNETHHSALRSKLGNNIGRTMEEERRLDLRD